MINFFRKVREVIKANKDCRDALFGLALGIEIGTFMLLVVTLILCISNL